MDPFFNGQPPPAPAYAPAASSFFGVPVPVFPTTFQPQPVQVGEMQPATNYLPSFQEHPYTAPNSNPPSHPPYNQMITEAISALKEREGSSRQAIAKYIELFYPNLPSTHSTLLTQHLKHMKENGQLVMFKHSYMLPGSVPEVDMPVKRSPGRPPKLKPVMNSSAVQQSQQALPANDMDAQGSYAVPESVFASIGLVDGVVEPDSVPKKRPGRPKKTVSNFTSISADQNVTDSYAFVSDNQPETEVAASGIVDPPVKRRPGRPPKNGSINVGNPVAVPVISPRGRGRPKQNAPVYTGKPRGRPRRNVEAPTPLNSVSVTGAEGGDGAAVPIERKRRPGRPPTRFADETKKPRHLPIGRHKQNEPATTARVSNLQQLLAYQELKIKLEFVQSRIKHCVGILKPFLVESQQTSTNADEALEELEEISVLDVTASSSLHTMTLLPPNQV